MSNRAKALLRKFRDNKSPKPHNLESSDNNHPKEEEHTNSIQTIKPINEPVNEPIKDELDPLNFLDSYSTEISTTLSNIIDIPKENNQNNTDNQLDKSTNQNTLFSIPEERSPNKEDNNNINNINQTNNIHSSDSSLNESIDDKNDKKNSSVISFDEDDDQTPIMQLTQEQKTKTLRRLKNARMKFSCIANPKPRMVKTGKRRSSISNKSSLHEFYRSNIKTVAEKLQQKISISDVRLNKVKHIMNTLDLPNQCIYDSDVQDLSKYSTKKGYNKLSLVDIGVIMKQ